MIQRSAFALAAALTIVTVSPAVAQEKDAPSLMEQGLELFFDGLRDEMGPTMDSFRKWADEFGPSMQAFMAQMGPALAEIMGEVKDWSRYEMPEVLPNGDIIIRRKSDSPDTLKPLDPPAGADDIEI